MSMVHDRSAQDANNILDPLSPGNPAHVIEARTPEESKKTDLKRCSPHRVGRWRKHQLIVRTNDSRRYYWCQNSYFKQRRAGSNAGQRILNPGCRDCPTASLAQMLVELE
jgi:hypothetical protein